MRFRCGFRDEVCETSGQPPQLGDVEVVRAKHADAGYQVWEYRDVQGTLIRVQRGHTLALLTIAALRARRRAAEFWEDR